MIEKFFLNVDHKLLIRICRPNKDTTLVARAAVNVEERMCVGVKKVPVTIFACGNVWWLPSFSFHPLARFFPN